MTNKEVFEFLEKLRISGETNMLGAGSYIQDEFGVSRREAKKLLLLWINHKNEQQHG